MNNYYETNPQTAITGNFFVVDDSIAENEETGSSPRTQSMFGWLVGCFGCNGHLRQYFSLYRAISPREGDRRERIDGSKIV